MLRTQWRQQVVELSFAWSERHPVTGEPLREWVEHVPERWWDKSRKVWVVDPGLLPAGFLTSAGFTVVGPDGSPARKSVTYKPPPGPVPSPVVPEWFGLELFRFQRDGALEILSQGKGLLADEPGLGKTRTALAVAASLFASRIAITCPASVLAHWESETKQAFAARPRGHLLGTGEECPGFDVVVVRSGRKQRPLPCCGAVICSDSLLAARPAFVDDLCAWSPEVFVYDEVHNAKTWTSKRSMAARAVAWSSGRALALSGTPMFARPDEIVAAIDMTGHLGSVFSGRRDFVERYCVVDRFGNLRPRKARLKELRGKLDAHIWVRRVKSGVLSDLPPKSRQVTWLDIDTSLVKAAHKIVDQKIDNWLSGPEHLPDKDEIWEWCRGSLSLVSDLRRAAGLAKVGPLTEVVAGFIEGDSRPGGLWDRPLVVWAHHREVVQALAESVPDAVGGAEVIAGATPVDERSRIVKDFQSGRVPVLVCSIKAAGVGITLTRSADVVFAEMDWTPALITQAEDRCARIGQKRPVQVTTYLARGSIDEAVVHVLSKKTNVLDDVMSGGDNDVMGDETGAAASKILYRMVQERLARLRAQVPA